MKFLWTLIWSLLIGQMVYYVLSAMSSVDYNFVSATIIGVIFTVFVSIIGSALSSSPEEA